MTIQQLKIFAAVAENESITLAASSLYLAQPAVSHSLSLLEEELGVPLFVRSHQRLHLSEAGKRLLPYAQNVLNGLASFQHQASSLGKRPLIRIGSSLAFGEKTLPETLAGYPQKDQAEFHCAVLPSPEAFSLLEKGAVDFAFLEVNAIPKGYEGRKIFSDRLAFVAAPSFPCPASLSRNEAATYPWLLRDRASGIRQLFEQTLSEAGISLLPSLESTSNAALLSFAEQGMGIALLPISLVEDRLEKRTLKEVGFAGLSLPRNVYLVYGDSPSFSKQHRDFLAYLLARFA